jgi:hypothetical protein
LIAANARQNSSNAIKTSPVTLNRLRHGNMRCWLMSVVGQKAKYSLRADVVRCYHQPAE